MTDRKRCGDCEHFEPDPNGRHKIPGLRALIISDGCCVRNPPAIDPARMKLFDAHYGGPPAAFPRVHTEMRCGEFKRKEYPRDFRDRGRR